MSGQAPYGYQLEPTVVEGIRTKKMVADPVAADHVRLMFEMYAEPETSFGDITLSLIHIWIHLNKLLASRNIRLLMCS